MGCRNCGFANGGAARFCVRCGTALGALPATQWAMPPQPPPGNAPPAAPQWSMPPQPPLYVQPARTQRGMQPRPLPGYPQPVRTGEPAVAAILSLLVVGLGQFYNGDHKKGVVMLAVALVVGVLSLGLGWVAMAAWSAVDAHQVAAGSGRRWS